MSVERCLRRISICLAAVTLSSAPTLAEDYWRGQRLYDEHCYACHDALTHPGKKQKVHSLNELRRRIASWGEHTGQYWRDSEIEDVLYYLNKSHYHFDEEKGKADQAQ
jgi:mono/diheme cytochrome c family protein